MHHIGPDIYPVPYWMKKKILGTLAGWLMMKKEPEQKTTDNIIGEKLAQDFRSWEQQELLSIVQNQIHNSPRMRQRGYNPCNGIAAALINDSNSGRQSPSCQPPLEQCSGSSVAAPIIKQTDVLTELLREVRKLTNHIDEGKEEEKIRNEWKRVALVMDRLFMIIFVFGTAGTYLIMFAQM